MSYRIREDADGFSVFQEQSRTVQQTTVKDGVATTEVVSYRQMFRIAYDPSVFDAWYKGDGYWEIDLDCGAQRWRGSKSTKEVRQALRKCGFDTKVINALFTKYTKEKDA